MEPVWVDSHVAALLAGCGRKRLAQLVAWGKVPGVEKVGRRLRFRLDEFEPWAAERRERKWRSRA